MKGETEVVSCEFGDDGKASGIQVSVIQIIIGSWRVTYE